MSKSTRVWILCVVAVALAVNLLRPRLLSAQAGSPQDPRTACAADVQRLCCRCAARGWTNHRLPQAA